MITLIQISDCHLLKDKDKSGYDGIAPFYALEAVLRDVSQTLKGARSLSADSAIVLVTGDISGDNSKESYTHFLTLMKQYIEAQGVSWFAIAGNHDNNAHFDTLLTDHILTAGSPIHSANWLIHGCDTRHPYDKHGARGSVKQQDVIAIEKVCDANQAAQIPHHPLFHIVALHHHVRPSQSWMDKHALAGAEYIEALVSRQSGIKAVLHGHVHSPIRQHIGERGTPSYGCPSSCWQWAMQETFGTSEESPGYQQFTLCYDGTVEVNVRRVAYKKH